MKYSRKYVPCGLSDNMATLVQKMAWGERRQAIIWSNVGMFYWRIFSSLGLSELTEIALLFRCIIVNGNI